MYCPSLLNRVVSELKSLFNFDCPIVFTDMGLTSEGVKVRGRYYFKQRMIRVCLNQSILEIIETICHEVIHHKQQIYGLIKGTASDIWYRGQWYPRSMSYHEQPWELEANSYMRRMFSAFCVKASRSLVDELYAIAGRK